MKNSVQENDAVRKDESVKTCSKCDETKSLGEFQPSRTQCKECVSKYQRDYRERNREQLLVRNRESRRRWRKENPDKDKKCSSRWRKKHPFGAKLVSIKHYAKKNGYASCSATEAEVEAAFMGKCDICGVPEQECLTKLHLDHDHSTGEFRGFLCGNCNRMLGLAGDSEDVLVNALHYLMVRVPE